MAAPNSTRTAKRTLAIAVIVALIVLTGIFIATQIDLTTPLTFEEEGGRPLIIEQLTLGALLSPEEATKPNPKLRQAASYAAGESLALRVTTDPSVTQPFTISVRLLAENGQIIELSPSQATFQPGTSTFCCWQAQESGTFSFQIFRPEKIITSLPIVITPANTIPKPLL